MLKFSVIIFLIFFPFIMFAQHTVTHSNMLWVNYNNNIRVDSSWSVVNDVQLRTKDWADKWSQFAVRTGLVYNLKKNITVTLGFAWFASVSYFNNRPVLANEWRPWQEIAFQKQIRSLKFIQRVRLEQRFLQQLSNGKKTNDFETRHRLRYRFEFGYPVCSGKYILFAGNEVMGNLNYIGTNRFFDQNRTFAYVNCKLSPKTIFQFQYIKVLQWRATAWVLEDNNVFRFSIHQQLSLKK